MSRFISSAAAATASAPKIVQLERAESPLLRRYLMAPPTDSEASRVFATMLLSRLYGMVRADEYDRRLVEALEEWIRCRDEEEELAEL